MIIKIDATDCVRILFEGKEFQIDGYFNSKGEPDLNCEFLRNIKREVKEE